LLEELLQAEVSRRLPELWTLARDLHRRDWGRPQVLRRTMRDISAFLRSSGFTLRTVAPHINDGFAGVATGRAPGPHVLLAAPLSHGAVAAAMAAGAATALAALRLRWPGEVTVLVLAPGWEITSLNREALALADQTAALGATVGRLDCLAAPVTYRSRARIVFHRPAGGEQLAASEQPAADALQAAVQAYQHATERGSALPGSQRLTAELHTRQASRRGVSLAELHVHLEALDQGGLAELVTYATELAGRWGGVVSVEGGGTLDAAAPGPAAPDAAAVPPVTAPPLLWRKLGRQPTDAGGWDVVPNDLAALTPYVPVGVSVLGIGKAPGEPGFAQAVWGGQGERALRDGATLLAWQAAHILTEGVPVHGRAEAAAASTDAAGVIESTV
jgi:hypothetical protein